MSNRRITTLPKHTNPTRTDRTAAAPYNFVPLPDVVVTAVDKAENLPNHDSYVLGRHTGHFDVTLTTRSPLYVRCPLTLADFLRQEREEDTHLPFCQQVKNTPHFFYTHRTNQPVIPGSSLRGMLRGVLEIMSYGKVERVTDSFKVTYRAVAAPNDDPLAEPYRQVMGKYGRDVRAGYLVQRSDGWCIRPAKKPSDLGLPDRDAFLKIREWQIPSNAIPGFVRLNSDNYTPQYHPVTFDIEVRKDRQGRPFARIVKIGTIQAGYARRGWLVCSGNMLETGGDNTQSRRRSHVVVLEPDDEPSLLKINPQTVSDYLDALTPFQKKQPPFNEQMGCLVQDRPIFYVESAGEVLFFGHCPNFRIPMLLANEKRAATPFDLVPRELCRSENIDYADALFGYTKGDKVEAKQGEKTRAYASRVFVTDATVKEAPNGLWLSDDPITPKILATPKPTAFQHYLTQQEPNIKDRLDHYGSPPPHETVIRGHKRYWHQGLGTEGGLSLDDIRAMIEEEKQVLTNSTQHTQFKPVKPKVTFTFRVYFENLSDSELGALCWTLHPLGDSQKEYCHHLGMGKPLGMGAVKLEATLCLTNRPTRYGNLFHGDHWETGVTTAGERLCDRAVLEESVRAFESDVLSQLGLNKSCTHLSNLTRIGMLLKLMEWPTPDYPNARYMTIQSNQYKERLVLPDPSMFGTLTGDVEPTTTTTITKQQSTTALLPPAGFTGTKRERVTVVSVGKKGKGRIRTEEGEEIGCIGLPVYQPAEAGTECRADVTRTGGQAVEAVFKGWS